MYTHQDLNQAEAVRSTTIDENRFPVWNHELVYYPPKNVTTLDGFINFFVKDRYAVKPLQKIIIPVNTLRPYHPVHLDLILNVDLSDLSNSCHFYLSICLEDVIIKFN